MERASEWLPGKHVRVSTWAGTFFSLWSRRQWREKILMLQHMSRTWASAGWEPSSEREKHCMWCFCCFQALFGLQEKDNLACATEIIVWCHKEKNPLLDASDVFTEASIRCREISVISEKKKKVIAFPLKVIQNTGQISPNCFSENNFLLRTKLCQSEHVPL